jgi:hypothetical protein
MSAVAKKAGGVMKRSVEEMRRGAKQIRSASVSKNAEGLKSTVASMKIVNVKRSVSLRRRRVSALLLRGSARMKNSEREIGGRIDLRWSLGPTPT